MSCISFYDLVNQGGSVNINSFYNQKFKRYTMHPHRHNLSEILYLVEGMCRVNIYRRRKEKISDNIALPFEEVNLPDSGVQIYLLFENDKNFTKLELESSIVMSAHDVLFFDSGVYHQIEILPNSKHHSAQLINIEFGHYHTDEITHQDNSSKNFFSFKELMKESEDFLHFIKQHKSYCRFTDNGDLKLILEYIIDNLRLNSYLKPPFNAKNMILQSALSNLFLSLSTLNAKQQINSSGIIHVRKAVKYIEENFESNISVDDLAKFLQINTAYLQRLFKKHMNKTIMTFVNELRMEKAELLVKSTNLPLHEIAEYVGFNSRQSFNKAFTKYFLKSPLSYRRNYTVIDKI